MFRSVRSHVLLFAAAGAGWLAAAIPAAAQQPPSSVISRINATFAVYAGYGAIANGGGLDYWINTNTHQVGVPPDPCLAMNLCSIIGSLGGRSAGAVYGGEASLSMPLWNELGIQFDGAMGHAAGYQTGMGRAHVFVGLASGGTFGALIQYQSLGGAHFYRFGGEGQIWFERWSLYGTAGYQGGARNWRFNVGNGLFACGEARWYVSDNTNVSIGAGAGPMRLAAFAGAETQLPDGARDLSLFARGGWGEDNFYRLLIGARWHWGGNGATQIARHRTDMLLPYAACGEEQFDGNQIGLFYQNAG